MGYMKRGLWDEGHIISRWSMASDRDGSLMEGGGPWSRQKKVMVMWTL